MGNLRELLGEIPVFYRYLLKLFFQNLLLVLLTSTFLGGILSSLLFFNIAKDIHPYVLIKYVLSSVGAFIPFFFPLLEFTAVALTVYGIFKRKLNLVVFTFGIPPRRFFLPIFLTSLGLALSLMLYFEFVYPYAGYVQKIAYREAKNKAVNEGVAENFWYKLDGNRFLYFRLINLNENLAFDGKYFKVNGDYQLEWVIEIPRARFWVEGEKIVILADRFLFFSKRGKRPPSPLKLELKYETKLLKVKNPQFFSVGELLSLLTLSKYAGLNYYPYLWELVKRLLLVLFSAMVPVIAFIRLFSSTGSEEFLSHIGFLSFSFVSFYVALIFFQNAVGKVSLNPLYGFLLLIPYLFLFYKTLKED